jgi:hypothetical protein
VSEKLFLHPHDPYRPADWRWQLATFFQRERMRVTRSRGGKYVAQAKNFAIAWDAASTTADRYTVINEHKSLFEAWSIFMATGSVQNGRWELEARLLAGQSYEEIANTAGIPVDVIEVYERTFFDVRSRLNKPGLIVHAVIKPSLTKGISDRDAGPFWKLFGYCCGPGILDQLIYGFSSRQRPSSSSELKAWMSDDIREQLKLKAMIAIHCMQINWQTQSEVMNLYQRMIEFAAHIGSDGGDDTLKAGIQAMLENLPWTRSAAEAAAKGLVNDLENNGVGLRADELMLVAAGQTPTGLKESMASAVFPPRERKTTVSS